MGWGGVTRLKHWEQDTSRGEQVRTAGGVGWGGMGEIGVGMREGVEGGEVCWDVFLTHTHTHAHIHTRTCSTRPRASITRQSRGCSPAAASSRCMCRGMEVGGQTGGGGRRNVTKEEEVYGADPPKRVWQQPPTGLQHPALSQMIKSLEKMQARFHYPHTTHCHYNATP